MVQIIKNTKNKVYFLHKTKVLSMSYENLLYDLKELNDKDLSQFTETSIESFWTDDCGTEGTKKYAEIIELILPENMCGEMLKKFINMNIEKNSSWWHGAKDATNSITSIVYLLNELAKKYDIKIKCKRIEGRLDVSAELFDEFSIVKNDKNIFTIENASFVSSEFAGFINVNDMINFIETQIKYRKIR